VPGPLPDTASEGTVDQRVDATPEQTREAEGIAAAIADPDLREYVAKAIKSSLTRTPDDRSV
jgi:hypothetical protein